MALLTLAVLVLSACASYQIPARAAYHPAKPMAQQDADHNECLAFAKGRTGYDPATSAVGGGLTTGVIMGAIGAGLGAALGAATGGGAGTGAAIGGAIGGLGGAAAGGATEMERMHQLFTKQYSVCMRSKGYTVE